VEADSPRRALNNEQRIRESANVACFRVDEHTPGFGPPRSVRRGLLYTFTLYNPILTVFLVVPEFL
jgi:hypothetical protein